MLDGAPISGSNRTFMELKYTYNLIKENKKILF